MRFLNDDIRLLNPHIDDAAYPVYFTPEFVDQGKAGLKKQGLLGLLELETLGDGLLWCLLLRLRRLQCEAARAFELQIEARGDIWVRAQAGPRNSSPMLPRLSFGFDRIFNCIEAFGSLTMPLPGACSLCGCVD